MSATSEVRPRVGVGVIVRSQGRVLLGRRRTAHGAGCWSFPGGHLEFGEGFEDCARREVLEETGLRLCTVRFAAVTNDVFSEEGRHYVTVFMVGTVEGAQAPENREPDRCEGWEWFEWDAMPSPRFTPIEHLLGQGYRPGDESGSPQSTQSTQSGR